MSAAAIVEACVYRQSGEFRPCDGAEHGAELTRHVKYTPQAIGPQTISIPIEQTDVDIATLKVESADQNLAVLDVGITSKPESYETRIERFERAKVLYAQFKELTRSKAKLQLSLKRLKTFEEHLSKLPEECRKNELRAGSATASPTKRLGEIYVDSLETFADKSLKSHIKISDEIFSSTKQLEKVNADLEKCQTELYNLSSAGLNLPEQINVDDNEADWREKYESLLTTYRTVRHFTERQEITVTADIPRIEPIDFKIRYSTRGGSWSASYDLKVKSDDLSVLDIFYYSQIQQNSSEDWKDINLVISTGRMSIAGAPPQLAVSIVRPEEAKIMTQSFRLKKRKAAPRVGGMLFAAAPAAMMMDDEADMGFAAEEVSAQPVEMLNANPLDSTPTQAAYRIGQKVTVLADSTSPTRFLISNIQLPMQTIFYCAPEVDLNVHRACRLTNTSEYYLVDSLNCSIFWDGSYMSSTQIPCVAPGDSFNLFLGQAEKVKIKVNPPKHWIKSGGGMLNQKDRLYYERAVMVSNYESAKVMMFLAFNLIEAQDDDIKVSLDKISDVIEISAPDDISILASTKFPDDSKRLQWIYNPVTRNCIALLFIESQAQETVTFSTVIESPNGRVISIKPIYN